MAAIVVSVAIIAAGLWLTFSQNTADLGWFGAMLLVVGTVFLAVNLYLRHRGFRTPRRRP
jgi:type IV secretory pathway VirB2 component (pilin)